MAAVNILIIVSILSVVALAQQKKVLKSGDGCRLESKKKGICRPFSDCPAAVRDVAENDKWPLLCQYNGDASTSIVCCDELGSDAVDQSTTTTTTTTVTPSTTTTTTATPATTKTSTATPSTTSTTTTTPATTKTSTTTRKSTTVDWIPSGILSRRMCQKYSRWMKVPTLSLADEGEDERVPGKCGAYVETFIYGGVEAERLEFPHMAHLGFTHGEEGDEPEWSCGGSLISEEFVLTAAHCLRKRDGTNVTHVRLGSADTRSEIIIKVVEPISHPGYKRSSVYNDIALLKLAEKVKFTDYRRPACLQANRNFINKDGLASGWGATEDDRMGSRKLLKVKLPFLSHSNCSQTYVANPISLPLGVEDRTMVCAGTLNSMKDTCQGDSGGPLQIVLKQPHCMYSIVGITSFGIKCGIAPGVYTRVSAFVPWIESIVWPQ